MQRAAQLLRDDAARSPETPLARFPLPEHWGIDLYFKDESAQSTGSLKHRLARALIMHAVMDGRIRSDTPVIEASSGSTAVSEAFFARMLGLPFIAVVPSSTSPSKLRLIESFGGSVHTVRDAATISSESVRIAERMGGYFVDQFANASRVTDWTGETGIAAAVLRQLEAEPHPVPEWVVVGAGTGGTITALGRYVRSRSLPTRIALADPEGSAFFAELGGADGGELRGSRIEGVGRPRVEPSFVSSVVDVGLRVSDRQSIAGMRVVSERLGIPCGPSTGMNFVAALRIVAHMRATGARGSVVTLLCDGAERYQDTYYDEAWLQANDLAPTDEVARIEAALSSGVWTSGDFPMVAGGVLQ